MLTLSLALASSPALACGGFFCSNIDVAQSAERILFAVDEELGEVEAHVQIFYSGPAPEFAWVVPTPSIPELFTSSDEVFAVLDAATRPTFVLEVDEIDECTYDPQFEYDYAASPSDADGGVEVVAEEQVGPYDTVTLQATSSEELLAWLLDNGFNLPTGLDAVLAPYVADQSYFVAMRLSNDKSVGDIQPIGMRYVSDAVSVPIQLTSIAATPDMRVEAFVLGATRSVPESYLHVQINEAAIDWFGNDWFTPVGSNYADVITRAANEAGGHAFATDFSGSTSVFDGAFYDPARYDLDAIANAATPAEAMDEIMAQFPANALLISVLIDHMPPPAGVEAQDFYNCVACFTLPEDYVWDPVALAAALDERIVAPLEHAEGLFAAHPHLSRLTSSLDAIEMTVDPTFVFNPDMAQEISNIHTAQLLMYCGDGGSAHLSLREIVFEDGRSVLLPSEEWLDAQGLTELDYMGALAEKAALIIERTSSSGEAEVLADYTGWADDEAWDISEATRALAPEEADAKGCGCSSAGQPAFGLLALLPLLAIRRRR